jgi:acylpyruvate hydrolase
VRVATARLNGASRAVRLDQDTATPLAFADVGELLASGEDWAARAAAARGGELPAEGLHLETLVPKPDKIICAGLNYRKHILESGRKLEDWTTHPMLFAKFSRSLLGPQDDLVLPDNSDRVDWEAELAVVVGREVWHAGEDEALAAIAGYTVINDVSMRDWQTRTTEMLQGKTFERSTPLGPVLVTGDEIDHARDLRVACSVDDQLMQDGSTADMIFGPAALVAYASQFITLVPGDIIATGTPSGIGGARKPPIYLRPGQTMFSSVEGIGECVNRCVAATSGR